jgi:hypothetical protein
MSQLMYWKSPVRTGVSGDSVHWWVDHGTEADMPTGAMTGDQDFPTALEIEWKDIERLRADGTTRSSMALSVLSPPVFGRRYVDRASASVEVEELERLATNAGDSPHLLALYLPMIRAGQIDGPAKGSRRENNLGAGRSVAPVPRRPRCARPEANRVRDRGLRPRAGGCATALWGEELPNQRCTVHKHGNLLARAPAS